MTRQNSISRPKDLTEELSILEKDIHALKRKITERVTKTVKLDKKNLKKLLMRRTQILKSS